MVMGGIVLVVLFTVVMLLWFLANMSIPAAAPYTDTGRRWLAFFSVLLLALYILVPGLR
jgi:hypothetical protein